MLAYPGSVKEVSRVHGGLSRDRTNGPVLFLAARDTRLIKARTGSAEQHRLLRLDTFSVLPHLHRTPLYSAGGPLSYSRCLKRCLDLGLDLGGHGRPMQTPDWKPHTKVTPRKETVVSSPPVGKLADRHIFSPGGSEHKAITVTVASNGPPNIYVSEGMR